MSQTSPDWAETTEQQVLEAALRLVPSEGWTRRMSRLAGQACGLAAAETELLLPHGPADLAALFSRRHDARAVGLLGEVDPAALKIRERIRAACEARLDVAALDEAALRRWMGWLALPPNLALGARCFWESADVLWRWAGDTATDENHYSKRALLAGILSSALAVRMASGRASALAFVDNRIGEVMAFEAWKAGSGPRPGDWLARAAQALGRRRYGAPPPA